MFWITIIIVSDKYNKMEAIKKKKDHWPLYLHLLHVGAESSMAHYPKFQNGSLLLYY